MKTKIFISIIIITTLLLVGKTYLFPQNIINIHNQTNETISSIEILVCKKNIILSSLAPHSKTSTSFIVSGDSGFIVKAKFSDSKELNAQFGYVTGGAGAYGNIANIIIKESQIIGNQL